MLLLHKLLVTSDASSMDHHPLRIIRGCPVATIDGRDVLIDTGTPSSAGELPRSLKNRQTDTRGDLLGLLSVAADVMGAVHEHIDPSIVGIAGTDVLSRGSLCLDWRRERVSFDAPALADGIALDLIMGVPAVDVEVNGQAVRCFVDTGAARSYFTASSLPQETTGSFNDFFPLLGAFSTTTHPVSISVGGRDISTDAAKLPGMLGMALSLVGVSGVLGMDVLGPQVAARTTIDLQNRLLRIV